jgi:hypothetical protein
VGEDDRPGAGALEGGEHVEEEGVVAVLCGRRTVDEAVEGVVDGVHAAGPGLGGKRGIGNGVVEGAEGCGSVGRVGVAAEAGVGERVAPPQFRIGMAVEDHVHLRQRPGGDIHLLAVDRDVAEGLVGGFEEQ